MTKEITITGTNGTFKGTIEIRFNDRKQTITANQPVTHDDVDKVVYYHRIYARIEGQKQQLTSKEFTNELHVFQELEGVESALRGRLDRLANTKVQPTVKDKLIELGFK